LLRDTTRAFYGSMRLLLLVLDHPNEFHQIGSSCRFVTALQYNGKQD
jgi:hypothetical protein